MPNMNGRQVIKSPFHRGEKNLWFKHLPEHVDVADVEEQRQRSSLMIYEDGQPLNQPHCGPQEIIDHGRGRFCHWLDGLYFSTSDNSDPNANGRQYSFDFSGPSQDEPLPLPRTMHLNLTTACNLNCRICRPENYKYKPDYLSREILERIVEDVFGSLTHLRLDSGGELTLSPHLQYVLEEATKRDIEIFISTNGARINPEFAKMICRSSVKDMQVSVDSPDKETLEWIRRGAKFEKVIEGTKNLVEARKWMNRTDIRICFHAAILQQNLKQVPGLFRLAKEIGIEGVTFAYGFTHAHMNPEWSIIWRKEETDRIMTEAKALAEELGLYYNAPAKFSDPAAPAPQSRRCNYLFESTYIDPSGKVFPCCIGGGYVLGDTNQESLREIWHGEKYKELRRTYNTPNPSMKKCAHCYITGGWDPNDDRSHFAPAHWPYVEEKLKKLAVV